jgi:hypothetical protein
MAGKRSLKGTMTRGQVQRIALVACAAMLLLLGGCVVQGLKRGAQFDSGRTFQTVVVLPSYGNHPDCNREFCAVLFTDGNVGIYFPRVESRGPGAPRDYNLTGLWAYQVSDGSILFAAPGSNPTEYGTGTGAIRIEFQTGIGTDLYRRDRTWR